MSLEATIIQGVSIGIAGALGALSRWGISAAGHYLLGARFAWGTLIANVTDCFALVLSQDLPMVIEWVDTNRGT